MGSYVVKSMVFCAAVYSMQALIVGLGIPGVDISSAPDFSGGILSDASAAITWVFQFLTLGLIDDVPWWLRFSIATYCIGSLVVGLMEIIL